MLYQLEEKFMHQICHRILFSPIGDGQSHQPLGPPWCCPHLTLKSLYGIGLPGQPALAFLLLAQHRPPGLGLGRPASPRNLVKLPGPPWGGVRKRHIKDPKVSCFPHKKNRSWHSVDLEGIYQVRVGPGKDPIFKTETRGCQRLSSTLLAACILVF